MVEKCQQQHRFDFGVRQGKILCRNQPEVKNRNAGPVGQWLAVRRDRPAWMIMWGWGAMNPTAVKRAAENGYPMDHFIGIWWSGSEDDARPAGPGGKGYLSLNFSGIGTNYPALQDVKKYVVDKGNSQVEKVVRRELL